MNLFPKALVATTLGGLSVLGWAPSAWWPIAIAAYAGLFYLLSRDRAAWQASCIGLAFGIGQHATGHGWMFEALHDKAGLGWMPAALSTGAFVVYLALFTALPSGWFALLRSKQAPPVHPRRYGLVKACAWTAGYASLISAGEYARSLFFNGFTSLSLGYALVDTWFAGFGAVAGVCLVSWMGLFCAASTVVAFQSDGPRRLGFAALAFAFSAAGGFLANVDWTQPVGSPISYRLLQMNVPQQRKFNAAYARDDALRMVDLIERQAAELIVTPETAFPQYLSQLPEGMLARLQAFSLRSESHLMIGMATTAADSQGHNTVLHIAPAGVPISQYHKVRLMPFGEYSPWGFDWYTRTLAIPLKDLSAGSPGQSAFKVGAHQIGVLICDEDGVGHEARQWVRNNSETSMLINPSNLAWFAGSLAIEQRLQMARMRAIEVGRPILRVANTGITAHIDRQGKVVDRLEAEEQGELGGKVQGFSGLTPYARGGDAPFLLMVLTSLVIIFFYIWTHKR